jgi:hypothetical protein
VKKETKLWKLKISQRYRYLSQRYRYPEFKKSSRRKGIDTLKNGIDTSSFRADFLQTFLKSKPNSNHKSRHESCSKPIQEHTKRERNPYLNLGEQALNERSGLGLLNPPRAEYEPPSSYERDSSFNTRWGEGLEVGWWRVRVVLVEFWVWGRESRERAERGREIGRWERVWGVKILLYTHTHTLIYPQKHILHSYPSTNNSITLTPAHLNATNSIFPSFIISDKPF